MRRFLEQHLTERFSTCGFCGGLKPELENGDVVFMTGYPALEKRLAEADATLATISFSPAHRHDRRREKTIARKNRRADVVEMDSPVILEACREKKIPWPWCGRIRRWPVKICHWISTH